MDYKTLLIVLGVIVVAQIFTLLLDVVVLRVVLWIFEKFSLNFSIVELLVAVKDLRGRKSGYITVSALVALWAITISTAGLPTVLAVMGGFGEDLKEKIISATAHIVIDKKGGKNIKNYREIKEKLKKIKEIKGIMGYVQGEVMLSSATNIGDATLNGIDLEEARSVIDFYKYEWDDGSLLYLTKPEKILPDIEKRTKEKLKEIFKEVKDESLEKLIVEDINKEKDNKKEEEKIEDPFLKSLLKENGVLPTVIIGRELANALRVFVGDEINIISPLGDIGPTGPIPKVRPFRVGGIFYSGLFQEDFHSIYVDIKTAQRFLSKGDSVDGIRIKLKDIERSNIVKEKIKKILGKEYRVRDWQDLNANLYSALKLERLSMIISFSVSFILCAFTIFATLTMMVIEKRKSISVLKALGSDDRSIVTIYILEGLLLGFVGTVSGIGLGYLLCTVAKKVGIHLDPEITYIDTLPVKIDVSDFILVAVVAMVLVLLITIPPAIAASRLNPVDGLRE